MHTDLHERQAAAALGPAAVLAHLASLCCGVQCASSHLEPCCCCSLLRAGPIGHHPRGIGPRGGAQVAACCSTTGGAAAVGVEPVLLLLLVVPGCCAACCC